MVDFAAKRLYYIRVYKYVYKFVFRSGSRCSFAGDQEKRKKVMLLKIKRLCSFLLVLLVLAGLVCAPFCASASVTANSGKLQVLPGHPRSATPVYSKAWLDNVVIRDSASAITAARLVPKDAYPYRLTFDEFVTEVGNYSALNLINEKTVSAAYGDVVTVMYYLVTALGMTGDSATMKKYIRSKGITIPPLETAEDEMKVAVVYAAMKYDAVYTLYQKKITLPQGITLDNAICVILAALTGTFLPSGVDTLSGFAVNSVKTYISQFDSIPVSSNPGNDEIFHWAKVITATSNNYEVPTEAYNTLTEAEKEYVDYAYFASILGTVYGVKLDPVKLVVADRSEEKNSVQTLILQTMLDESGVDYSIDDSCETLFKAACECGKFPLDEQFYSDIFSYDLYAANDCQKIWFTPFALASQIGGDDSYLKIYLGEKEMSPGTTVAYVLDASKSSEVINLKVVYEQPGSTPETVLYKFNVVRKASSSSSSGTQGSLTGEVQKMLDGVIPADNEKANSIVSEVMSQVDSAFSTTASENGNDVLTTYATGTTAFKGYDSSPKKSSDGVDFGYLAELMSETYKNAEQASSALEKFSSDAKQQSVSFVQKTVQTIKENPEVAVAPTGIIALGGLGGYIWTKRKKTLDGIRSGDEKLDKENSNNEKPDEESWFED